MRAGKLSSEELNRIIFTRTSAKNAEIVQSAALAEDCAAVRTDKLLLLTTDPVTAAGANAGRLSILVSANDVAASGGVPLCCLLTLIAPVSADAADIEAFMREASEAASENGIDIIGGHTEFSASVNRMIAVCTMAGTAERMVRTGGAMDGDTLLLTKTAAVEGTAIMAADNARTLLSRGLTEKELSEAAGFIERVSVIPEARAAVNCGAEIHAMHDVTEGGVYGAVTELAEACGLGAVIDADSVPVAPVTERICALLKVSPMRVIGSGSLLIATPEPGRMIRAVEKAGVDVRAIGRINAGREVRAVRDGESEILSVTPDELFSIDLREGGDRA